MRLTDLNPCWVGSGGEGVTRNGQPVPRRDAVALDFDCPCGCGVRCCIHIENPFDGGGPVHPTSWQRTGESFETLTLTPSILRIGGCGWHGFITNGEIVHC